MQKDTDEGKSVLTERGDGLCFVLAVCYAVFRLYVMLCLG